MNRCLESEKSSSERSVNSSSSRRFNFGRDTSSILDITHAIALVDSSDTSFWSWQFSGSCLDRWLQSSTSSNATSAPSTTSPTSTIDALSKAESQSMWNLYESKQTVFICLSIASRRASSSESSSYSSTLVPSSTTQDRSGTSFFGVRNTCITANIEHIRLAILHECQSKSKKMDHSVERISLVVLAGQSSIAFVDVQSIDSETESSNLREFSLVLRSISMMSTEENDLPIRIQTTAFQRTRPEDFHPQSRFSLGSIVQRNGFVRLASNQEKHRTRRSWSDIQRGEERIKHRNGPFYRRSSRREKEDLQCFLPFGRSYSQATKFNEGNDDTVLFFV